MAEQGMPSAPKNGNATASLVLGILAVLFCWIPFVGAIGLILGVVGLVLAISAKKAAPSRMATAGLVLSIIGMAFSVLILIPCIACLSNFTLAPNFSCASCN